MAIDIGALKKFQDQWSPVLEAIPAVIDAASKQGDLERDIAIKQKQLDKIKADVADAMQEAEKQIESMKADVLIAVQERNKVASDIGDAKLALSKELEAEQAQSKQDIAAAKAEATKAKKAISESEQAHSVRVAELDAEFAGRKAALEAEIKAIEDRKVVAEKALEAIRAKLG